jgi:hypothetical protein
MVFGRRKKDQEPAPAPDENGFVDDLDPEDRAYEDALLLEEIEQEEAAAKGGPVRPQGPWDIADAPAVENPRLDLGSLHVAVLPDTDVRLEVSPEGQVVAAVLVHDESALQVNAFAAPRSEGIWEEVRNEILESLREAGGSGEEAAGTFGPELKANVPTEVPGQGTVLAPARFVGVDGPRWFLRGLLTGPAAVDDAAAAPLLEAMKHIAVDRGSEPMAVTDPLPLTMPADAAEAVGQAMEEAQQEEGAGGFPMPERGPEITETR